MQLEINNPTQRFNAKWTPEPYSGCWLWFGAQNPEGYGRFRVDGVLVYAHRWSYEEHVGVIPNDKQLDHLCGVPSCVNPVHLEPVTNLENTLRGNHPIGVARRTSTCIRGHPWNPNTAYYDSRKYRHCRLCHNQDEAKARKEGRR